VQAVGCLTLYLIFLQGIKMKKNCHNYYHLHALCYLELCSKFNSEILL